DLAAPRVPVGGHTVTVLGDQFHPGQAGAFSVALARACTLPGVGADMVMIAAAGQEHRLRAVSGYRVEAECLVPEALRLNRIADAKVHMADDTVLRHALPSGIAGGHRADNAGHIHAGSRHPHLAALPGPLL